MASTVPTLTYSEAEALCASNYPCPPGYDVPAGWRLSTGGVPVPPVPQGLARRAAITNHYYLELTPEQRMDSRWQPDYRPTWDAFFIERREKVLARYEEDRPRPSNFNEAGRRLWWAGRTLKRVMDYITAGDNPRLRYPQLQSRRQPPSTTTSRPSDDSDDDDGDYDDYTHEYYRPRQEYD
jgi:hypothetical protein